MRVLISAYVCRRGVGSEPENGYNYVRAAAARHEVTVITHSVLVDELRQSLAADKIADVRVIPVRTANWSLRLASRGIFHVDYIWWQFKTRRLVRKFDGQYDVAHHATYGTDWMPPGVLAIPNTPVVWGSVGGLAPVPWRLRKYLGTRGLMSELVREAVTRSLRPATTRLVRKSNSLVVARNRDTAKYFERKKLDVVVNPHVVSFPKPELAPMHPIERADGLRRAVYVSKFVLWKGPVLAVAAIAAAGDNWHLDLYGRGKAEAHVRRAAEKYGVADRVHFKGHVPKSEIFAALRDADALIFPSMHDSAPMPVAEAGWVGCPVVCLDVAGPPVLIEGTTGIAVAPDRNAAKSLGAALNRVQRHPPSDRWNADNLVEHVDSWYRRATGS